MSGGGLIRVCPIRWTPSSSATRNTLRRITRQQRCVPCPFFSASLFCEACHALDVDELVMVFGSATALCVLFVCVGGEVRGGEGCQHWIDVACRATVGRLRTQNAEEHVGRYLCNGDFMHLVMVISCIFGNLRESVFPCLILHVACRPCLCTHVLGASVCTQHAHFHSQKGSPHRAILRQQGALL